MASARILRFCGPTLLATLICFAAIFPVWGADPQPYQVTIATTGNAALDTALKGSSQLETLRDKTPIGPFALVSRAKDDIGRLTTALESFGYYASQVHIELDGKPLDDPKLPEILAATPASTTVIAAIKIETGPLYHLRKITVAGPAPPDARERLELKTGQPAIAADILGAQGRLLSALQETGHALAKVDTPIAFEDPEAQVLDISYKADAGPAVVIGDIAFKGLEDVKEDFVRRRLLIVIGQLYQPSKIEDARKDLAALGVFSGVSVHAADKLDSQGRMPLIFEVKERPKHVVALTAAYSTDLGGSLTASWSDRNLFGSAEQLNLSASGTGIGGDVVKGFGYNVTAQLIQPDFRQRDQSLEYDLGAIRQDLESYSQIAVTAGVSISRKFSPHWSGSIGLSAEDERIDQEHVTRDYQLLGVPITAKYDTTDLADPLADPTHGFRVVLSATPTLSLGKPNAVFAILQTSASAYFDLETLGLSDPGRSVFAIRGLVGSIQGASQFQLPPDQRFYGGGSATVRGFKYQSIGPRFADTNPIGGTAIDAATLEFRQRLFGDFGAAAFIDAGQVSAENMPFTSPVRVGAGLGLRYYTVIGPVRLDVAAPVNRLPGDDFLEFYLGLGQAF